jgi:uncharacterized damage-inducible protein DinB
MTTGTKEGGMTIGSVLAAELTHEAGTTRTIIERLPDDKFGWKPHEKSMTLGRLAGHIIEMVGWTGSTLTQDGIDFATMNYEPRVYTTTAEMLEDFDKNVADALSVLSSVDDAEMFKSWSMRNGETLYFEMPKAAVMRSFVMNHIIHHRGQLAVYIRLLDIPVPSIYGPSADEGQM